jgi:DNA-binding transcriptional MocR family regulator
MSVYVMAWAWEQDCTPTEKFVLLALADHAKDDGTCWPGMKRLAEKTGFTRRTILNAIKSLGSKGLLESSPRHNAGLQTTNLYFLQAPDVKELRNGVKDVHPRCESLSLRCESDDTGGVKEVHTEPSIEPSIKQPKEKAPRFALPDWVPQKEWEAFNEMREAKDKRGWTTRAKELAVKALEKLKDNGNPPADVLNQSTMNGWKGLFEIKEGLKPAGDYRSTMPEWMRLAK